MTNEVLVANFIRIGLKVLGDRALTWATMVLTAALFGYAAFVQTPIALAAAVSFALLVFWRVTWVEKLKQPEGEKNA